MKRVYTLLCQLSYKELEKLENTLYEIETYINEVIKELEEEGKTVLSVDSCPLFTMNEIQNIQYTILFETNNEDN